jgi:DNA polymerase III alpha subunit
MANTQPQLSVKLKDRTLWFDGDSTINSKEIVDSLIGGLPIEGLFVDEITDEIRQYNSFVTDSKKIGIKTETRPLSHEWNIPDEYRELDVLEYLLSDTNFDPDASDAEHRCKRVVDELSLYRKCGLMDVLRVLIYVINTLNHNNVMWGVGRGSSVSSYVLYLIGVHDIDSVKYELDITEFLRST